MINSASVKNINRWSNFKNLLDTKTKQEKGQAFEELSVLELEKLNHGTKNKTRKKRTKF
jgi:hypothetical protein